MKTRGNSPWRLMMAEWSHYAGNRDVSDVNLPRAPDLVRKFICDASVFFLPENTLSTFTIKYISSKKRTCRRSSLCLDMLRGGLWEFLSIASGHGGCLPIQSRFQGTLWLYKIWHMQCREYNIDKHGLALPNTGGAIFVSGYPPDVFALMFMTFFFFINRQYECLMMRHNSHWEIQCIDTAQTTQEWKVYPHTHSDLKAAFTHGEIFCCSLFHGLQQNIYPLFRNKNQVKKDGHTLCRTDDWCLVSWCQFCRWRWFPWLFQPFQPWARRCSHWLTRFRFNGGSGIMILASRFWQILCLCTLVFGRCPLTLKIKPQINCFYFSCHQTFLLAEHQEDKNLSCILKGPRNCWFHAAASPKRSSVQGFHQCQHNIPCADAWEEERPKGPLNILNQFQVRTNTSSNSNKQVAKWDWNRQVYGPESSGSFHTF